MGFGIKIPKNALKQGAKQAKSDSSNDVELEPGSYTAAVMRIRGVNTGNGPQIVADLKVGGEGLEDHQQGGNVSLWFSLEENRILWLFKFLLMLGYEVDDDPTQADIEEAAEDVENTQPIVRLQAKQSGDYINYKADKLLEELSYEDLFGDEEEEDDEEEEEEGEEDADPHGVLDMTRMQMKKFIVKNDMDIKVLKSMKDKDLAQAIIAHEDYPPF